jgi:hypothetical protein
VREEMDLQLGDVADGVVLGGAVALDGRVGGRVVVDVGAVRGDAGAGVAADVPCRQRRQLELGEDSVQRRRCNTTPKTGFTLPTKMQQPTIRHFTSRKGKKKKHRSDGFERGPTVTMKKPPQAKPHVVSDLSLASKRRAKSKAKYHVDELAAVRLTFQPSLWEGAGSL